MWIESMYYDPNFYGPTGLYGVAGNMLLHLLVFAIQLHPGHHKRILVCQ